MAEFQAGEVVVPVIPDATGFHKKLAKDLLPGTREIGQQIGRNIAAGIKESLGDPLEPLKRETQKQKSQAPKDGAEVGGAFARAFKARLEAGLKSLPKAEIDADSTAAEVKIAALRASMESLAKKTIGVDIDAAAAEAELAVLVEELRSLDTDTATVDVRADVASALAALGAVDAEVSKVDGKTARAKVDVDISGALASIGVLSAALAGLAAIPVGASIAAGLVSLSGPIAAAGAGFAGFAAVAAPSVTRISEALKEQDKATQTAASSTKSAASTAAEAASRSLQLEQAERSIVDAKRSAKQAEEDLTQARRDARQAVLDLKEAVSDQALSEEDAALSVEEARARLDEVLSDPKSTELQRKRADLTYRQAVERLDDQRKRTKELAKEQAAADKKGIEGSDQVKAAKEKLAAANQQVKDAEAQLKVLRLQQAAAAAQEAKTTGGLVSKMSKLSPAAQAAAKQVEAFQDAYLGWQKQLEPKVLPVITGGLRVLQGLFKPLTPLVAGTAKALTGLEKSASKALGGSFWQGFFKDLAKQAPTAITGLGKSLGNVATGIAGMIRAFLPFTKDVVGAIVTATAKFADFGKNLGQSQGFKAFIAYAEENGPKVVEVVKNLFTVVKNLLSGLSGTGSGALDVVVGISRWLASLSPETLRNFTLAVLGVVAAFKTWKLITTAVDGVRKSIQTVQSVISGAKTVWSGLSKAASLGARGVKAAASGISSAVKGIGKGAGKAATAVWSGIQTAARKAASVAKTSATAIAGAAKTAGSAAAKGGAAAWDGIRTAAAKAGTVAKTAGGAILNAGKAAATAAVGLGKAAFQYAAIAAKAAIARAGQLLYAAATGIVRAATVAWTAVQWVLNAALNANPIGLIVLAIAALVGALIWAWNNSQTFRDIVMGVWNAISTAVQWAWTNVIQPVVAAMVAFWQTVLAPALTWLWQNVFKPAWDAIAAAVQWAWRNIIQPNLLAMKIIFTQIIGPAVSWLWNNVFKPGFQGIAAVVKAAWTTIIKPALDAMVALWKNVLGPAVTWLWKTIIVPAWDGIKTAIKTAWDTFIKPVFDKLVEFITKTIPAGFKTGVDLIGKAWDLVKEVAKKPVKFIVDVVYNNGIVKVWNAVADFLKLPKLSPVAFASGGIYPGYTPGRDIGLAAVSGGEAIMRPEWTRAVGEDYVHKMNSAARKGGVTGVVQALGIAGDPGGFAGHFADGGIVGDIKDAFANGIKIGAEKLLNPLLDAASRAMGDSPWAKMLTGIPRKMIDGVLKLFGNKEASTGGGKAVQFARSQIGKPYKWGATGPDSYDCSGLTMRAWQAAGVHDIPRVSQAQMQWVKPVKAPLPGDLGFPNPGHVFMYSGNGKIIEAAHAGTNVREVAARAVQLMGRPPSLFADGGVVGKRVAQIATQPTLLFGEAGKEAFIPLESSKRGRGLQVLGQAAAAMGQRVVPMASGGVVTVSPTSSSSTPGFVDPTGFAGLGRQLGLLNTSVTALNVTSSQMLAEARKSVAAQTATKVTSSQMLAAIKSVNSSASSSAKGLTSSQMLASVTDALTTLVEDHVIPGLASGGPLKKFSVKWPGATFDSGGFLMPGTSLVHNGTGRPEPVLTDRQWADMQGGTRSGDAPMLNIENFNATPEQSTYGIALEMRRLLGSQLRSR